MAIVIQGIPVPGEDATCASWKLFFERLEEKHEPIDAKENWMYVFNKNGNSSCTKSSDFIKWMKENDINVADSFDEAIADFGSIGSNIIGSIKSLTKFAPMIGKVTLVITLLLVFYALFRIVRQLQAKDVINAIPQAKGAKLLAGTKLLK